MPFNTDRTIEGGEARASEVDDVLRQALGRSESPLTRVEAHPSDANAERGGAAEIVRRLERRVAGRRPEAVSHDDATAEAAVAGAARKAQRCLDRTFGRLDDRKGAPAVRKDAPLAD